MKKFRILSVLLVLSILFQFAVAPATAQDETNPIQTETFQAMKAMGLLTDDFLNISAGSSVTRAQFVGALYKLTGLNESNSEISLPFVDVDSTTPHREAIAYFYNIGAVSGSGNNMFNPDGKITYAQAVKVICDFLGYRVYLQQIPRAYPGEYISLASNLNLAEGIELAGTDTPMNAASVVTLIYNAANSNLAEVKGNDGFTVSEDETPLTRYNNIYYGEEILKNNGIVSLDGNSSVAGTVVFGKKSYAAPDLDLTDYLGMKLSFFYKSSGTEDVVLWAKPTQRNDVLTIKRDDLLMDDPAYSVSRLVYDVNNRRKTADISDMADIVYNNALTNIATVQYLKPQSGEIKLIDNNGDKVYDTVIIKDYKNLYVNAVSAQKEFISDKYGVTLDLSVYNNVKIFNEQGKAATLNEISPDSVVSYLASPDSKDNIYIYMNPKGKKAILDSVSNSGSKSTLTFEGEKFLMAPSMSEVITDGTYYVPQITPGQTYMYYLDIEGKVAAIKDVSGNEQYAFFIKAMPNDEPWDGGDYKVKILLSDGITSIVTTSDKFQMTGYDDGIALDQKAAQTVKVRFDSKDRIRELKFATPLDKSVYPNGYNKNDFTLDFDPGDKAFFKTGVFEGCYSADGRTLVFVTYLNYNGEVEYKVVPIANISQEHTYRSIVHDGVTYPAPRLYDADEYMHVNVLDIVIRKGDNVDPAVNMMVDQLSQHVDEDGEIYTKIEGYVQGKYSEYNVYGEGLLPEGGLKRGDIIRVARSGNVVNRVVKSHSLSDPELEYIDTTELLGQTIVDTTAYGYLHSFDGSFINLYKEDGWNNGNNVLVTSIRNISNLFVAIYDARTDEVYPGTMNDLYQNCTPQADGTFNVDEHSTKVYIVRRYGYIMSIFAVYY